MQEYFPCFPHPAVARFISLMRSTFAISARGSLLHPTSHHHLPRPPVSEFLQSLPQSFGYPHSVFFEPSFANSIPRRITREDGNGGACRQERRNSGCVGQESKSTKSPKIPKGRSCSSSVWETTTIPSQFTSTSLIFLDTSAGIAPVVQENLIANTTCRIQRGFGLLPVIGLTSTLMITWEVITS